MRQIQNPPIVESFIAAAATWKGFRRWLGVTAILLLVSLSIQMTWPTGVRRASAKSAVVCVNPGGTGGCLASIQAAINAAASGDTINVAAGTYTEDLNVTKSVSLAGAGASSTILLGAANNANAEHVVIAASNVTIEGFTIDDSNSLGKSAPGANTQGITIGDFSGTIIRRNIITNVFVDVPTGGTAIYLGANTKGGVIEQNIISNSGNGILFDGSGRHDNFTIRKNILSGNGRGTSSSRAGIRFVSADSIAAGHNNVIVNNSFISNINGGGINNASGIPVIAENNWWGCNFGPGATGAGCSGTTNGVSSNVDANPWLVLRLSPASEDVPPGGSTDLTASLLFNSNNADTSNISGGGLSDSTLVTFAATPGAVVPQTTTTTNGKANAVFTADNGAGAADISATVNGQTVLIRLNIHFTIGPGITPDTSSPPGDGRAGSVLIFNVFTSSSNPGRENTRISLTNIEPSRPAYVRLFFVDGASCSIADLFVCLTPEQTTSFLASDLDPNVTGYIIAVAVNQQGCPINFNSLIGDEYVKFQSGHAANLGAEAVTAIGDSSPCGVGLGLATLAFDGLQFTALSQVLAVDGIPSRADGDDTLLILNRIGGNSVLGVPALGTLSGMLFDDQELGVSFSLSAGACQFRAVLSNSTPRTNPRMDTLIPAGHTGWMKIWVDGGTAAITGAALNFNPNVKASAKAYNQGHNLHKLALTNTASLVVPVLPPNC